MIQINENLSGKVIVITGAAGVLCGCIAKELVRHGAKVALLDLNEDEAQKLALKLGDNAIGVKCNVLEKCSVSKAKEVVLSTFGKCDILINGAGGNHAKGTTENEYSFDKDVDKSFYDLEVEGFSFVFDLNFIGTFIPTQVFMSDLVGGGNIINVSSMSSIAPLTKVPAYSAAKAAINNFTMWLATHFACENVRVNAIAPGFFITKQNKKLLLNDDNTLTSRSNKIIESTPMRRFGEPEDLLGTILWLCDDNLSGFVTGITVPIDGGYSSYSGV